MSRRTASAGAVVLSLSLSVALPTAGAEAGQPSCSLGWDLSVGTPGVLGNDRVESMVVFDDGNGPALYVAGSFEQINGVAALNIARWDGIRWSPLGQGVGTSLLGGTVNAMTVYDDGSGPALYVAGFFAEVSGISTLSIARWDGAQWSEVGGGLGGSTPLVEAMTVFDDGTGPALYVGGRFSAAGTSAVNNIARWNGVSWSDVAGGTTGSPATIGTMIVMDLPSDGGGDQALVIGGAFTVAGGRVVNHVARLLDGAWQPLGDGLGPAFGLVHSMCLFDTGIGPELYVGGQFTFTSSGGSEIHNFARWTGASWVDVGNMPRSGIVHGLAVFDDGGGPDIYLAAFMDLAGQLRRVVRWDGGAFSELNGGPDDGVVLELAALDDGQEVALYLSGGFTSVGGEPVGGLARWGCFGSVTGDVNGDGVVDVLDLLAVLGVWGPCPPPPASCPADLNGDGVVDVQDLLVVLGNWG